MDVKKAIEKIDSCSYKILYQFKCRVCGFIRSEYTSIEESKVGIKCWLNYCGGIMDKIEEPIKKTITIEVEAGTQGQIDWIKDYIRDHMNKEINDKNNFHQITEGDIKVNIRR